MELTGLDVRHAANELAALKGAKIQKVYQTEDYELILDLYSKVFPYRYLYIKMPNLLFAKNGKPHMPDKPLGFAHRMRPHLTGALIHNDYQKGMDRIIVFMIEKRQKYYLIVELFGKGNIVLCNEDMKIINILLQESFSSRTLKPGKVYEFPPSRDSSFESYESFCNIVETEKDKYAVSTVASLGFGGKYSDIIMKRVFKDDYDKITWSEISKDNVRRIHELMLAYANAGMFREKGGDVFAETNDFEKGFTSFFACLDSILNVEEENAGGNAKDAEPLQNKKEKAIEIQRKRHAELSRNAQDDSIKGQKIYENYEMVERIIRFAQNYKEKNRTLDGIEDEWLESKGNKIVVELN